jgi:hypothetical protein
VNIVEAKEVLLTDHHLCLVMEYAAGNSLTGGRLLRHNAWIAATDGIVRCSDVSLELEV